MILIVTVILSIRKFECVASRILDNEIHREGLLEARGCAINKYYYDK